MSVQTSPQFYLFNVNKGETAIQWQSEEAHVGNRKHSDSTSLKVTWQREKCYRGLKIIPTEGNWWYECWYWSDTFYLPKLWFEQASVLIPLQTFLKQSRACAGHIAELWGYEQRQDKMYLIIWYLSPDMLWCIRYESLEEDGLLLHFTPWLCIACLTGQKCPNLSAIDLFLGNWPGWYNHWVGQVSETLTGVWRCKSSNRLLGTSERS